MGTRKNNKKSYLLDYNGKVDPGAVRSYLYMLKHPSYFSKNIIFVFIILIVLIAVGSGIIFLLGKTALWIILAFLAACWIIVRV